MENGRAGFGIDEKPILLSPVTLRGSTVMEGEENEGEEGRSRFPGAWLASLGYRGV
jgi:hypothetical protein